MNNINLNDLNVVNRDYDLDSGFFWVEFENGKSLQCCLVQARRGDDLAEYGALYLGQVELDNNGFDDGLSYDNNAWAKDEDGEMGHINGFLIEQARMCGLEIVS